MKKSAIFLFQAAVFLFLSMTGHSANAAGPSGISKSPLPTNGVVVYQFHRRFRCESCYTLEATINDTIKTHFPEELKAGKIVFKVVDLDAEGNSHYEKDYDFFYNTVIVVLRQGEKEIRFKNLEEVWSMVDKKDIATEFIRSHISDYMKDL